MATEFRRADGGDAVGEPVALRYWGGCDAGTRVDLLPGADRLLSLDEPLVGDDGTLSTLRGLAGSVGAGRRDPRERVCPICGPDCEMD